VPGDRFRGPAVGILEAEGFVAVFDAAEAMAKAADVEIGGLVTLGSGLVAVTISGSLASVQAAMHVGERTVRTAHDRDAAAIVFASPCPAVMALAADPTLVG
jgi:microcompartment protein CcmL/EutN